MHCKVVCVTEITTLQVLNNRLKVWSDKVVLLLLLIDFVLGIHVNLVVNHHFVPLLDFSEHLLVFDECVKIDEQLELAMVNKVNLVNHIVLLVNQLS